MLGVRNGRKQPEKCSEIDLNSFTKNFKIKFIGIKSLDLLKMSTTEEKPNKKQPKESKPKKPVSIHFNPSNL
jgi:hypothetical protein